MKDIISQCKLALGEGLNSLMELADEVEDLYADTIDIVYLESYSGLAKPEVATLGSAGTDLRIASIKDGDSYTIKPGGTADFGLGIKVGVPKGTFLALYNRSGLAFKKGVGIVNAVGIIDSDYTGEVRAKIYNNSNKDVTFERGDRVVQAILQKHEVFKFNEVTELNQTSRGDQGFGSTGL